MFRLSFTMTLRDWRAGELRFLLLALTLSVAALSTVNFFVDRLRTGLERDAHQMLAADLELESDQPLDGAWLAEAQRRGLHHADTVSLFTMAVAGEGEQATSTLVALKSVSETYPLRGRLRVRLQESDAVSETPPAPGTVWVDATLLASLRLHVGSVLSVGERSLTVAQVLTAEPDAGVAFLALAPRVMMANADLAATGLLQAHAIANYRLLLAGSAQQVSGYERWARDRMAAAPIKSVALNSFASKRGDASETLDQTRQFLSLASLLTALLAALAVALAARRFVRRHLDACAMLRCLGLTQARLTCLFALEFLLLGLAAGAAGVAIGYGSHFALVNWLGQLAPAGLPPPGWAPALQGMAASLILLLGFALPPVLQLRNVPQLRLLRRDTAPPQASALGGYVLGLAMFGSLLAWQTGDVMLALVAGGAFVVGGAAFALLAWLGLALLKRSRGAFVHAAWRLAVTDMTRQPGATVLQVTALALGLTALLLLTVVRADLLAAWMGATPVGAPNQFVINIQPDQRDAIDARLRGYGAPQQQAQTRARLLRINGRDALEVAAGGTEGAKDSPKDNAKNNAKDSGKRGPSRGVREMLAREIDIGHAATLPSSDKLTAGNWYGGETAGMPAISIEENMAADLKLKLGDTLQFDVAGQALQARVSNLRKVDWRAHQIGNLLLMHPSAMRGLPATWAVAVHVPADDLLFGTRLARDFPNLTVVDLRAILRQVQRMLAQAVAAVQFLFAFTLAAGVLVLYAALAGSHDLRARQAALLRALGATRGRLAQAQWIEHLLTGALAGLLAAASATLASWALSRYSFHLAWSWSPLLLAVGMATGAACALAGGWLGLRNVLNQPPLLGLRSN
ncbi:ABC transporter permease [Rugamonas apoptosis]|uniref:FtsX-like permease family protein n=1 Tax=Rugamonas apoptosis TaxID=2758570 RepID=A0A7W2IMY3_9BURK|nr:FtsX-like permease family protein [Rugamonas apoptosis]MBA5690046.1 FtsX-like permease family protein [Rugamonas apoptosis]